ncbi:hypothetical protein V8C86DRAFT_2631863 [Haematococcus lacustris]
MLERTSSAAPSRCPASTHVAPQPCSCPHQGLSPCLRTRQARPTGGQETAQRCSKTACVSNPAPTTQRPSRQRQAALPGKPGHELQHPWRLRLEQMLPESFGGQTQQLSTSLPRRQLPAAVLAWAAAAPALSIASTVICALGAAASQPAHASMLPAPADRAWEALGGGPADLTFPASFLGQWEVTSVLVKVDTPLGPDMVPDQAVVERARREDLQRPVMYKVAFRTNSQGEVVYDRAFNTAAMLSSYYDRSPADFLKRIRWNPDDPNVLQLSMPDGLAVRTRVTRRLEDNPSPDRIETSEYLEQVFEDAEMAESQARASPSGTRLKASQCFTKYKYRSEASTAPGQPAIVATQVVSDFLTPNGSNDAQVLQAMNKPVVMYTYKMAFRRVEPQLMASLVP